MQPGERNVGGWIGGLPLGVCVVQAGPAWSESGVSTDVNVGNEPSPTVFGTIENPKKSVLVILQYFYSVCEYYLRRTQSNTRATRHDLLEGNREAPVTSSGVLEAEVKHSSSKISCWTVITCDRR